MRFPCRATLSLTLHGRGSISSRPWEDLVTAVGGSRHDCGKKLPRPWEGKDSGGLIQLYRHLTGTLSMLRH